MPRFGCAEPRTGMLQHCKQRRRRETFERGFRDQQCKPAGRRIGERIAAGILRADIPALKCNGDTARQRAIRCYQSGETAWVIERFAQHQRDRQRLLFRIRHFDGRNTGHRLGNRTLPGRLAEPAAPLVSGRRRSERFACQDLPPSRCCRAVRQSFPSRGIALPGDAMS